MAVTQPMPPGSPQGPWHPRSADPFRTYIEDHQARMMHHAKEAVEASNRWRERDVELADKFKRQGLGRFAISQRKADDMDLADAWSAFSFHSTKAQLHSSVLQGLAAARAVLSADADADPTGLGYSREDDEPVAGEVPPGVEGHAVGGRRRPMSTSGRVAQPGDPMRVARSEVKGGAVGSGASLPHPARGGAAA